MRKRIISIFVGLIIMLMFTTLITTYASTNIYLSGYEGNYFISDEPDGRSWIGTGINIYEITDEYIRFDFDAPHSGHATVYTAEKAYFTSPYAASAIGTVAYADTPYNTNPLKYDFVFTDNNINLKVYAPGDEDDAWNLDYPSQGKTNKIITVTINGSQISFDQPPIIIDDRTMVPIRAIFEAMRYDVSWDDNTKTAIARNGNKTITVQLNNNIVTYTDGSYYCDVAPQIVSDRILVPVRAIAESSGYNVDWDAWNSIVRITS